MDKAIQKTTEGISTQTAEIKQIKQSNNITLDSVKALYKFSEAMYRSGMFPNVRSPFGAMAIIEYAKELGLPPIVGLQTMSNIKGRICIEAKAMLALAIQKGVRYKIHESSRDGVKIEFKRDGFDPLVITYTIEDAKKSGVYFGKEGQPKDNWHYFPEEMCFWRAVSKGLRIIAPDIIMNLYTKEEMEDSPLSFNREQENKIISFEEAIEKQEPEEEKELIKKEESQVIKESTEEEQEELSPEDNEKEAVIQIINNFIKQKQIDRQEFLGFIYSIQGDDEIVRKKYNNFSLHEGTLEGLKKLYANIESVYQAFRQYKTRKKGAK